MQTKILTTEDMKQFLQSLMQEQTVVAPVLKDGISAFEEVTSPEEVKFTPGGLPRVSAKNALLPRTEVLLYYKLGKDTESAVPPLPPKPQVLFGLHPCDVQAVKTLDAVFAAEPSPDELYLARRRVTTIVGLGVPVDEKPAACFFEKFGISSLDSKDCDLFLTEVSEQRWLLEILTEKGEKAAACLAGLPDASPEDKARLAQMREQAAAQVSHEYDEKTLQQQQFKNAFDADVWRRVGERCIGCGACTFLCPTCHCFDVQDETRGDLGCRVRNWDTCQFELFTKHASGHNPRSSQQQRLRQRIMHKFDYGPNNLGCAFCVGCGRCVSVCPVRIDIREILEELMRR